jgi:hypothetical protein
VTPRDKRRAVFYLSPEDHDYLAQVAEADEMTKGRSMSKLVRWLRSNNVRHFEKLKDLSIVEISHQ